MPTILRLEALDLPRKTYELNDAALRDLETIKTSSRMNETAAIHLALRNLAEMVARGIPVYVTSLPQGPEPPTSAPSGGSSPTPTGGRKSACGPKQAPR